MPLIGILSGTVGVRDRWRADPVSGEVSHEQKVQLLSGATAPVNHLARAVWFSDDRINGNRYTVIGMGLGHYQSSPWENWFCLRLSGKND